MGALVPSPGDFSAIPSRPRAGRVARIVAFLLLLLLALVAIALIDRGAMEHATPAPQGGSQR